MKLFKTTMSVLVLLAVMFVPTKKGCTQCLINESSAMNRFVTNPLSESKIAYAYPDNDETEAAKEEPSKRKFFGMNVGIGFAFHEEYWEYWDWDVVSYHNKSYGLPITLGFDFAAPITSKFNLGFFYSIGYEVWYQDVPMTIGPLFIINFNKGSLYTGAGIHTDLLNLNFGSDLRLGYKFNFGLYIFYEQALLMDGLLYADYGFGSKSIIHIGFNFLNKKK